ncbi:gliding motility protein GldL [Marinilongibacter aquaticus]|uniref:type IX secretion system motor protein PorL/GldL n=1 Tax=Marinilongibacter aquaticus TaxID=2975157 RepID=UPI0021BD5EA5|nr:gliding motility protein GldL [Marinilongibacter aquaticus]UBM58404.1 gliding motility protein GldL [Marinilongibacter aquaticus]
MAANNEPSFFWDKFIPFIYGLGAAVVIIGAMGKIMHYDWAGVALPLGLGTEAVIFLIYAFQSFLRPNFEYQWEKVYPELVDPYATPTKKATSSSNAGLTAKMDDLMGNAGLDSGVFDKLKTSFTKLTDTVSNIGDLSDATVATNEYASNVKSASSKIGEMNNAYGVAVTAMNSMADATKDAQEYRDQFQKITQNMGALNAVYELELQDTNKHLKAMNAFYGNLSSAMEDMSEASKNTQEFKNELGKLTNNLSALNNVYGSMLTAMKGSQQ